MEIPAKKSLGQHFLNSEHALGMIIEAADIKPEETVLEIGPGTGILTKSLLKTGATIVSIEKDIRSIEVLKEKFAEEISKEKLKLISGDVLTMKPEDFGLKNNSYALVANIPYYITGAILQKFLEEEPRPNRMVLLVQKEVADRIIARDGKESLLSVSVKIFGTPSIVAKVPRGAFTPPPTVDSAILSIKNISNKIDIKKFFAAVKAGFAHKRKFLKRNLEQALTLEQIKNIWETLKLDEKVRAEDIKLTDWMKISELI